MAPLVRREDRAGSAVLVLDSPANRNALSRQVVGELESHLADLESEPSARAVVITGSGNTFCAGADLSDPPVQSGPGSFTDLLRRLWDYPKPVVAAVNGHVRAGGFGLVGVADVGLCASSATFALTEVRLGLVPAIISVVLLRRMTPAAASRYMLTGETFGPAAAAEAGLVHQVVPDAGLAAAVDDLLETFRGCEPGALRITRHLLHRIPAMDVQDGFAAAEEVSRERFASAEAAEGIASFREKRPPSWAAS
ncbi:MAG TPA: enoyl-CoA hydratase-related protein [Acidimicrobiales bacterium]|nr:enoyl-CoA hydratase-related protein [Acidimicrobiales bacterium]